jgi:hypothetical protein
VAAFSQCPRCNPETGRETAYEGSFGPVANAGADFGDLHVCLFEKDRGMLHALLADKFHRREPDLPGKTRGKIRAPHSNLARQHFNGPSVEGMRLDILLRARHWIV